MVKRLTASLKNSFFICILIALACNNSQHHNTPTDAKIAHKSDSDCLKSLITFADTLTLDTARILNYYFNKNERFSLKDCDLKKLRGNFQMESAIVLILLKIDEDFLKAGSKDGAVTGFWCLSKTAIKIIDEGIFLDYKKEFEALNQEDTIYINFIEHLIGHDERFLKISKINSLYKEVLRLEKGIKVSNEKKIFFHCGY